MSADELRCRLADELELGRPIDDEFLTALRWELEIRAEHERDVLRLLMETTPGGLD